MRALAQLEKARAQLDAARAAERAWQGFAEPPPYSVRKVDALRDAADSASRAPRRTAGGARLTSSRRRSGCRTTWRGPRKRSGVPTRRTRAPARTARKPRGGAASSRPPSSRRPSCARSLCTHGGRSAGRQCRREPGGARSRRAPARRVAGQRASSPRTTSRRRSRTSPPRPRNSRASRWRYERSSKSGSAGVADDLRTRERLSAVTPPPEAELAAASARSRARRPLARSAAGRGRIPREPRCRLPDRRRSSGPTVTRRSPPRTSWFAATRSRS